MSIELKIKSKHLALEPAIIRKEERKLQKQIKHLKEFHQVNDDYSDVIYPLHRKRTDLHQHRVTVVRNEARATYLARAYLKGIPYKSVEQKCDPFVLHRFILPRVMRMVAKYGPEPIRKYHQAHGIYDYLPKDQEALFTKLNEWCTIE